VSYFPVSVIGASPRMEKIPEAARRERETPGTTSNARSEWFSSWM
jgi:hypothetical protein